MGDFSKLLADAEAIEDDVKKAETDCKQSSFSQQYRGASECITDIEGVATSAMDIVSQAKSGSPDFSQIIQDAQTIASDVVAAKSDCHFKKFDSFELGYGGSCEEDIEAIAQTALDLVQSVSGGDWAKAAEDVVKLKTDIAAAEADCKKEAEEPAQMWLKMF